LLKKTIFSLLCLLLIGAGGRSFFAMEIDGYLRIGLEQYFLERAQINIYSQNIEIGIFSGGNFHSMGSLSSLGRFEAIPAQSGLAQIPLSFGTLGEAQMASELFAHSAPAWLADGTWGLFIPAQHGEPYGAVPLSQSTQRILLFANNEMVLASDRPLQFRDISGITNLGVRQYRGIIEFARFRGQNVTAVNIIHMDEYLNSVVPSEMPASWHIDALRAQAVAARTFTLHRMASWAGRDYDLCDTVFSQVYSGIGREHPNSTQAVSDTSGIIMLHNGVPISAVYSSCAGGITANSEDVWVTALPYLRSVTEIYPAADMLWQRTITLSQINQLLSNSNINIGAAVSVEIVTNQQGRVMQFIIHGQTGQHTLQRENIRTFFNPAPGGGLRSRVFTIVGGTATPVNSGQSPTLPASTATSYVLGANEILQANPVGMISANSAGYGVVTAGQMILGASSVGIVESAPIAPPVTGQAMRMVSSGYSIALEGRGWGHGVGMSQHGARAMAEMGYDFRQILLFYYTGIEITYMR